MLEKIASLVPDANDTQERESLFGPREESPIQEAQRLVDAFLERLRSIRVLDPACGSGNFLYVTLRMLKDLEKQILIECRHRGLTEFELTVGPHQLFGIEINPYAFDLAVGVDQPVQGHGAGELNGPWGEAETLEDRVESQPLPELEADVDRSGGAWLGHGDGVGVDGDEIGWAGLGKRIGRRLGAWEPGEFGPGGRSVRLQDQDLRIG